MARESEFAALIGELLAPFGEGAEGIRIRSMFGGYGVFLGDTMFALIADDVLYFKSDEQTRADFEAAGCEPFRYSRGGKARRMSYYTAPDGTLENAEEIYPWAERAIAAAQRKRKR